MFIAKYPDFPMFVNLQGKQCVVVGGGTIGLRRAETLLQYGADVCLIAPEAARELNHPRLTRLCRRYEKGDLSGAFLAVAATDKREINRGIGLDARAVGIPISVADRAAECTFKFPATVLTQKFSIGLISRQGDHAAAKKTSKRVKEILEELCEP